MNGRGLLSLANLAVAAGALFVWLRYPQYAFYALYLLFGWFIVSFTLSWSVRGTPAASGPAPPATGGPAGGPAAAPKPSPAPRASPEPPATPFCIFCGTYLSERTGLCPACGHRVVSLS